MLCAISGEQPQVPVVSLKSGKVYERRLIEAFIDEHGSEPSTGGPLTTDDLLDLRTESPVYPRPPSMTSIPAMLSVFQNEWDALALQTYKLQQSLTQTRQELSVALYENDAAVRVIASLTKERDDARAALAQVQVGRAAPAAANGDAMQVDRAPLPESIVAKIESVQQSLSKTRRKRPVPDNWATASEISTFAQTSTSPPVFSGGSVLAVDETGDEAVLGGVDGTAGVYSLSQQQLLYSFETGPGTATSAVWSGGKCIVGTSAGVVKVYASDRELARFSVHAGSVGGLALHPDGTILASVGEDKSYVLYDLETNQVLTQVQSDSALSCTQFHPDGHLLAAGGLDGQVKIFDVKSGGQAATFDLGAPVTCLFFSENGTWLAGVTAGSSSISIWDLRKAAEIKTIETGSPVHAVSWDYTGQFLAAAGAGGVTVEHYSKASKEWAEVLKAGVPVTRIAWAQQAHHLITLDTSGAVSIWGDGARE